MNEWLAANLVCPRDKQALEINKDRLLCPSGHGYPVYDDVPVMLVEEAEITHHYIERTLEKVAGTATAASADMTPVGQAAAVDDFVQKEVPYTSGILYFSVQNRLTRYPIPETRLQPGTGERLLDIGCNWGRWTIAAAKKGYQCVGIDPNLDAVLAARRVAKQMGIAAEFLVGDARFLPFASDVFDTVFSYGVFQHFSKENVRVSLSEVSRVLRPNGKTLLQMPNKFGVRSFYQRLKRGFAEGENFDVRYWSPSELMKAFEKRFGPTVMTADCYFGLGIQKADADLLPVPFRVVVHSSEFLRRISGKIPLLVNFADSLYLESINHKR